MGQYLVDPDGFNILDTVSGLGANLIECRNSFSLPCTIEVEAAEYLLNRIGRRGWKVKFVKTGSEADQAAVRFARGFTGRRGVLRLGYSGWHTEFVAAEKPGTGCIPTDVVKCDSHEDLIERLQAEGPVPAAVIMEPVLLDMDVKSQLKKIRDITERKGILLIFDEVILGFRMPQYTVAKTFNIWPDILTTGKACGGGYPLGVCMGRSDIMDTEGVFVSGTFSGEASALAACKRLLDHMSPDVMRGFFDRCQNFQTELQWAIKDHIDIVGYGTRMVLRDRPEKPDAVAKFMQEMYRRHKILIGPVFFPKVGWANEIYGKIVTASHAVCQTLDTIHLEGEPPNPIFKRQ